MIEPGRVPNEAALVRTSLEDASPFAETAHYFGMDSDEMLAWADYGGRLNSIANIVQDDAAKAEVAAYKNQVDSKGSTWMDNTTIVTAAALLSDKGSDFCTPVTIWDLATWCRSVVSYERIYHHAHDGVDDSVINGLLGAEVLHPVLIPHRDPPLDPDNPMPQPYNGEIYRLIEIWFEAYGRIKQLAEAVNTDTLDGRELRAVQEGWTRALGRNVDVIDLVDWKHLNTTYNSPSHMLLHQMVAIDVVFGGTRPIPPDDESGLLAHGSIVSEVLSDNNLRSYMNQQFADDFGLPYERGIARMPFQRHLAATAARIQQELVAAQLVDNRYSELTAEASLRLPIFLAVALQGANRPEDLWSSLAEQRQKAKYFRSRRLELDAALADRDLGVCKEVSKALRTDVDHLGQLLGGPLAAASATVLSAMAQGPPDVVSLAVSGSAAAVNDLLSSTLKDRILWRLRRPHLLYLNNLVDEAKHLTEAMSRVSQIWHLPDRLQDVFAERMVTVGRLQH